MAANSKSLWAAVKSAKDMGTESIPHKMSFKSEQLYGQKLADEFAHFVDKKVKDVVISVEVDNSVCNGVSCYYSLRIYIL